MLDKKKKWTRAEKIAFASLLISTLLGILVLIQEVRINSLSRGNLANDILISSPQKDTVHSPKEDINITFYVTSNYEGAVPVAIKLVEVQKDGEKITSDYFHTTLSVEEEILQGDTKTNFYTQFNAEKEDEYSLFYIFYYNYDQKGDYRDGKSKPYLLTITIEDS